MDVPKKERIPEGAKVRAGEPKAPSNLSDVTIGNEYIVECYVPEKEGDAEPRRPYYIVNPLGADFETRYAEIDQLTMVATPKEMAELRKMPDPKEIMELVSSGLHNTFGNDFEVYETTILTKEPVVEPGDFEFENDFTFGVEFYGRRRSSGTGFGGIVRLTAYWQTD